MRSVSTTSSQTNNFYSQYWRLPGEPFTMKSKQKVSQEQWSSAQVSTLPAGITQSSTDTRFHYPGIWREKTASSLSRSGGCTQMWEAYATIARHWIKNFSKWRGGNMRAMMLGN